MKEEIRICEALGGYWKNGECVYDNKHYRYTVDSWSELNTVLSSLITLPKKMKVREVIRALGAVRRDNIVPWTYVVAGGLFKAYLYVMDSVVGRSVGALVVRIQSSFFTGALYGLLEVMRRVGARKARIRSVSRMLRVRVCGVRVAELERVLSDLRDMIYDGVVICGFDTDNSVRTHVRFSVEPSASSDLGCVNLFFVTKDVRDVFFLLERINEIVVRG